LSLPLILRIFKNNQIVEVKQFHLNQIVIGRNAEVDLDLDDSRISVIHALIEKRDDRFYICDLGSQSGTFKNGIQIIDEPIDSGDEIQLGGYKIVFNVGIPRPKSRPPAQPIEQSDVLSNELSKTVPLIDLTQTVSMSEVPFIENSNPVDNPKLSQVPNKNVGDINVSDNVTSKVKVQNVPSAILQTVEQPIDTNLTIEKNITQKMKVLEKPTLDKAIKVVKGEEVLISNTTLKEDPKRTIVPKMQNQRLEVPYLDSEIDLNKIVKPGKGSVLEVSVAWQDRIIETYHFSGSKIINLGSKQADQIFLPDSILKNTFKLIELQGTSALVNIRTDMVGDLILQKGVVPFATLETSGRLVKKGITSQLRLDQGEALRVAILNGQVNIFIRFVQQSPKPVLLPFLPFSVGEIASLFLAFGIVGLMALYVSIHSPIEAEDQAKQEELLRMAQIIYEKPKLPPPDRQTTPVPPPNPPKPPEVVKPPEVKKVHMGDKTQAGSSAGNESHNAKQIADAEKHSVSGQNSPGKAAEIKPNPSGKSSKKFSSSNAGGSIKLGDKAGANAKANTQVDLSKMGLASSFGSGGIRQKIDQAVSGAGGIMGDALSATGSSGFKANRAGDDIGSAFKDTGASGKGTSTEGITGGITKGRSTGLTQYGSDGSGLGDHRGVEVSAPGSGEFAGSIDREAVRRVIRSKLDLVRNCYERELRGKPNLGGKVLISWRIVAEGKAENVKVKSSDLNDSLVENCIVQEFYSWRFPEPPGGTIADVVFPLVFQKRD
jgi:hypothetical protein